MKIQKRNELDNFMPVSFKNFLIDRNILEKYTFNFLEQERIKKENFRLFFDKKTRFGFISDAFYWETTPEGHHFWLQFAFQWYDCNK